MAEQCARIQSTVGTHCDGQRQGRRHRVHSHATHHAVQPDLHTIGASAVTTGWYEHHKTVAEQCAHVHWTVGTYWYRLRRSTSGSESSLGDPPRARFSHKRAPNVTTRSYDHRKRMVEQCAHIQWTVGTHWYRLRRSTTGSASARLVTHPAARPNFSHKRCPPDGTSATKPWWNSAHTSAGLLDHIGIDCDGPRVGQRHRVR